MKLVHTNSMVAHLWANQTQSGARNGNGSLWFVGTKLYSYRTLIAQLFDSFAIVSSNNMTPTTGKHLWNARQALQGVKRIIYSRLFACGSRFQTITKDVIIEDINDNIKDLIGSLSSKRTACTIGDTLRTIREQNDHLRFLGEEQVVFDSTTWEMKAMEYENKKLEKEKKRFENQRTKEQAQFAAWLKGESVSFPRSYDRFKGGDILTVRGNTVITSRGAQAPLSDVLKAIEFYYQLKQWPYETNGHVIQLGNFKLDSIDDQGNVKAGCHTFTAQEISRFVKEWIQ